MSLKVVNVDYLRRCQAHIDYVNSLDFRDIIFINRGEGENLFLDVTEDQKRRFELTGLNNAEFILSNFHKPSENSDQ